MGNGGPGLLGGRGRPGSLPGLEGSREPTSGVLPAIGDGGSAVGSSGYPSIGSSGIGQGSGPGTLGSGPGTTGLQAGLPGGNGNFPGTVGSASSSGFPEGGASLGLPASPSEPTFGRGSGISGVSNGEPGMPQPASIGGNGGLGTSESPLGGSSGQPIGVGGAGGMGGSGAPGLMASGAQGAGLGQPSRPTSGTGVAATRRGGRRRHKPLSDAEKAAIGLGVSGGVLALGALTAAIASAVQNSQRNRQGKPGSNVVRPAGGCRGCPSQPCRNGPGRHRRSIPESKVPAEVLESIPMNFERLY